MDPKQYSHDDLATISHHTIDHYQGRAELFWEGTRDHDVSQNIGTLLQYIECTSSATILDLGCGPGRDLVTFRSHGHVPVGLDGSEAFCTMARALSGERVLHQDFLELDIGVEQYDGIFANATLFHVPMCEIARVLKDLHTSLKAGGVLFSSNPRGPNIEQFNGPRYGAYYDLEQWRALTKAVGFSELTHYYRPPGLPREEQPWLASAWRKVN